MDLILMCKMHMFITKNKKQIRTKVDLAPFGIELFIII